jgi:hypothetical protein
MTLHDAVIMSRFLLFVGLALNIVSYLYGLLNVNRKQMLEYLEHNPSIVFMMLAAGCYLWLLFSVSLPDHPILLMFYVFMACYLSLLALPRRDRRSSDVKKTAPTRIDTPVLDERG